MQHNRARRVPAAPSWICSTAPRRSPALPRQHRALSTELPGPHLPTEPRTGRALTDPPKPQQPPTISHSSQGQTGRQPDLCYATPPHPTPPYPRRTEYRTVSPAQKLPPTPHERRGPPSRQRCRRARRPRPRPIARPGSPPYLPPCWVRRLDSRESHRPRRLAELSAVFSRERRSTSRFGHRPLSAAARAALWRRLRPQAGSELRPASGLPVRALRLPDTAAI